MSNPPAINRIAAYIKRHQVSLGLLLAAYGAFYLTAVILGNWNPADWGKDIFNIPPFPNAIVQRSYISPFFFVTSLPLLLVGATMLCAYSTRSLRSGAVDDGEHVAILLVAFGFAYTVIGAWPLGKIADFPWDWQKQIAGFGGLFTWGLYVLSVVVLAVGAVSLYVYSRRYHQSHPNPSVV
ncbi:MAG: hypothetical protein NWE93_04890 [Candidatus Bathyarchaeota archaeon]|nr:hypothetical protein [Candidatus Bathyarchaeota archaeon]